AALPILCLRHPKHRLHPATPRRSPPGIPTLHQAPLWLARRHDLHRPAEFARERGAREGGGLRAGHVPGRLLHGLHRAGPAGSEVGTRGILGSWRQQRQQLRFEGFRHRPPGEHRRAGGLRVLAPWAPRRIHRLSPQAVLQVSPDSVREIVRRSGSNLAYALAVLPRAVQRDMEVFYAFCRVVDDLVDDPHLHPEERRAGLDRWRTLVEGPRQDPRPGLEAEFEALRRRRPRQREDFLAILDGMEMDLAPRLFETEGELRHYCHHVAGAVGLVSATIFGCSHPDSRLYAEELGQALQWTNILRDVGEDAER